MSDIVVDAGPLPYETEPPPGNALCARAWDTFDPRAVYVFGTVGGVPAVSPMDDPFAYAMSFPRTIDPAIIRDVDGKLIYPASFSEVVGLFMFTADVGGVVADCRPTFNAVANDVELPIPACEDEILYDIGAFELRPGGDGYVYSCFENFGPWYDERGVVVAPNRIVVAVDRDGRLLMMSNDDPGPTLWVRDGDVDVEVIGVPEGANAYFVQGTARVVGEYFVLVAVDVLGGTPAVALLAIDGAGALTVVGEYRLPANIGWLDMRLDAELALYAISSDFVVDDFVETVYLGRIGGGLADVVRTGQGAFSGRSLITGP